MDRLPELATREALQERLDPWRTPQPPHGVTRGGETALQRAYRDRVRAQVRPQPGGGPSWPLWLAAWLVVLGIAWLLLSPLGQLLLVVPLALGAFIPRTRPQEPNAAEEWDEHYRAAYYRLARSSVPLLLVSLDDPQLAGPAAREALQLAELGCAADVHEALWTLAANTELFEPAPAEVLAAAGPASRAARRVLRRRLVHDWSIPVRARYAALYDYLFQPQEAFHRLLEQGSPAALQ